MSEGKVEVRRSRRRDAVAQGVEEEEEEEDTE